MESLRSSGADAVWAEPGMTAAKSSICSRAVHSEHGKQNGQTGMTQQNGIALHKGYLSRRDGRRDEQLGECTLLLGCREKKIRKAKAHRGH